MSRSEARIFTSIWDDDEDFIILSPDAKLLYFFLLSQAGLGHSGVITISERKWARKIGVDLDRLGAAMKELDAAGYTVVDEVTEELLVRALIRRDRVWQQPKMLRSALRHAVQVESGRLRGAIVRELARLDPSGLPPTTRPEIASLLANLPPRLASLAPKGPGGGGQEAPSEAPREAPADGHTQTPAEAPAQPLREAPRLAPAEGGGGGGSRNGSNHRNAPSPQSPAPTPSPRGLASPAPLWPCVVPDPEGEGDPGRDENPTQAELDAFVAEVRQVRPEWVSRSILRALSDPAVAERGWACARPAMLAMAADPASQAPGRLAHDGPWWNQRATAPPTPPRPAWCGECDERTRLTGGDQPGRCPRCHPLRAAS